MNRPNKADYIEKIRIRQEDFYQLKYIYHQDTYLKQIELYCDKLEKALDKAIKKLTVDNNDGMNLWDSDYEYWEEWCLKDE